MAVKEKIEIDAALLKKCFEYLDRLRESGATNMFGARPYLMRAQKKLSEQQAGEVLTLWMRNFSKGSMDERVAAAMPAATKGEQ